MSNYRTLEEISVEYLAQHPDEIEAFLNEIFAEYAQDGDSAALRSAHSLHCSLRQAQGRARDSLLERTNHD